jgi:SAM-dependent methyltransferase
VETADSVDAINARFYGRFPYPWSPAKFEYLHDPRFQAMMLNQDIGAWAHDVVPAEADIWVAGCGTNQSVFTALKFPLARVVGSDVSQTSLEICASNARQLGLKNLELRRESLNRVPYEGRFDYVICTGVIHHNADPAATLAQLARALKPGGVLELMVYNRFHWIIPIAFQHAIRILNGDTKTPDFESEARVVERLYGELDTATLMGRYVEQFKEYPESRMADNLLQPVMYSYTVESLEEMARGCGLEIVAPCLNQIDTTLGRLSWNLRFKDASVRELYEALPDTRRWQVTNLMLLDSSPALWFYLQREDSGRERKSERRLCEEFLDTKFVRASTRQGNYIQDAGGAYRLSPDSYPYPIVEPDESVRALYAAADGETYMRDVFRRLGVETTFETVNDARLRLTTTAFPFLRAVGTDARGGSRLTAAVQGATERKSLKESNREKFRNVRPKAFDLSRENGRGEGDASS